VPDGVKRTQDAVQSAQDAEVRLRENEVVGGETGSVQHVLDVSGVVERHLV